MEKFLQQRLLEYNHNHKEEVGTRSYKNSWGTTLNFIQDS